MTRDYALVMLLKLGDLIRRDIDRITGWPAEEVDLVLKRCMRNGEVVGYKGAGQMRYRAAGRPAGVAP